MLRWMCFVAVLLLPCFTFAKKTYDIDINRPELYENIYDDIYEQVRDYEYHKKQELRDELDDYFSRYLKEARRNYRSQHIHSQKEMQDEYSYDISDQLSGQNDYEGISDRELQRRKTSLDQLEKFYKSEFGEVQTHPNKKDNFKTDKDDSIQAKYREDTPMQQCKNVKPMFQYTSEDSELLFSVLDRMLDFWEKNYKEIIVDGLFGLRFIEGTAKQGLKNMSKSHPQYQKTFKFHHRIKRVNNKIYGVLKKRNTTYAQNFLKICNKPFEFVRAWRNVNDDLVMKERKDINNSFNEEESDHCIQLLLGVNKTVGKCHITEKCLKEETLTGTKSFYLTHEVLFFLAGEVNGCHENLANKLGGTAKLEILYDTFASTIYAQFLKTNTTKTMNHFKWDIGAEQAMIGGTLGAVECARIDYIREALVKWIAPEGCVTEENDDNILEKRVDSAIGRCSQHTTSVAMGYFGIFLNFIINPPLCELIS